MKQVLYYCAAASIIHASVILCSQPKDLIQNAQQQFQPEYAFIHAQILRESGSEAKDFIEAEINKNLRNIYEQNGCHNMAHMVQSHGFDTLKSWYQLAYDSAVKKYWNLLSERQAHRGQAFINW